MSPISDFSYKSLYINMQNDKNFYNRAFIFTLIIVAITIGFFVWSIILYNMDVEYRNNTEKANDFLTLLFPEYVNYSS